jgi:hypothetical protein
MRFAAVAHVTEERRIACSVRDDIAFDLKAGGELKVETTICHEIRQSRHAVVIDKVAEDAAYCTHYTPTMYGLQSYISMPIGPADGSLFGTLCAIDPEPHRLNTPETIDTFETFSEIIGYHLSTIDRMNSTAATLLDERKASAPGTVDMKDSGTVIPRVIDNHHASCCPSGSSASAGTGIP